MQNWKFELVYMRPSQNRISRWVREDIFCIGACPGFVTMTQLND